MTIVELINKSVLEPYPIRDNMDGTYSIKTNRIYNYSISHCDNCGINCARRFDSKPSKTYCSIKCVGIMQRTNEDGWRESKSHGGYIIKRIYNDPNFSTIGYTLQHRYIMSKHLGRKLLKDEMVHHIDMDKTNNDINNLWLCDASQHQIAHTSYNTLCAIGFKKPIQFAFDTKKGIYYITKEIECV